MTSEPDASDGPITHRGAASGDGEAAEPGDSGRALEQRASGGLAEFDPALLPRAQVASAAPPRLARIIAFASILVAGLCGGLIGYAFTELQCTGDCGAWPGVGALIGALIGAVGVAIVAVLGLRAMDEWHSTNRPGRSTSSQDA